MTLDQADDRHRVQIRRYLPSLGAKRSSTKHFCSPECRDDFLDEYPDENVLAVLDPDDPAYYVTMNNAE